MTCGDGGILVCQDAGDFKRAKKLKWFGIDREATKDAKGEWKGQRWEVDIEEAGYKYHMNNIAAAIGLSQMPHIERILNGHISNADLYRELFKNSRYIEPLKQVGTGIKPSHWVFTVLLKENIDRNMVLELLNKEGIGAGVVHIPNHNYTCFKQDFEPLPETDHFSKHQISLPCGWWLKPEDITFIADTVDKTINYVRQHPQPL
jgi:dTDP-4-amino-4,6-dideoxygalactose transaminase